MTKPSYEELRNTKHSGSPQIADSASGGESLSTAKETRFTGGNMVKKFRKKPVVISAIQVTPDALDAIREFMGGEERRNIDFSINYKEATVRITTLEGTMAADQNDWIIRGVKGEFYPCKPDIFAATYDAAEN